MTTSNSSSPRATVADDRAAAPLGRRVWQLIGALTLLRILLAAVLPLTPQEAYYWLWSRHLAWSYFDHPPLASYSIALSTAVFGTTTFGIKIAAVAWSVGLNIVWARLLADMGSSARTVWWTLLSLNLVGIIAAYGVVIAPDSPLLFAWGATLWAVWRAAQTGAGRWWYVAGLFLGLGLLAKYSAILLVPVVVLFLLASPRQRAWLARPEPYLGALLAAILFAPVIVWNAQHDWASFAFQTTQRAAGMGRWRPQFFLQMLATQFAVVTPYLLAIGLAAWIVGLRRWRTVLVDDRRLLLLVAASVPLVVFSLASLRSMVKPNWLAPAYAPLIVLAVEARLTGAVPRAFRIGLLTSAVLLLAAVVTMSWPGVRLGEANTWSGWPEAARRIDEIQRELSARGERSFVFSTNYKNSALLAFHRTGHARTYAQDIYGERALQFDFWPPERSLVGAIGILAIDDRRDQAAVPPALANYFESVTRIGRVEAGGVGGAARRIDLYECRGYRGHPHAERARP